MENIKILKANIYDAEGVQNLVDSSSIGMYKLCGWSDDVINNHFNPEKVKEGASKLKNSISIFTEEDILLVAKDLNNKIVGCCFATKENNFNKIEALYLLEEFQGTGLAKKIYENVYQLLNSEKETFLDVFSLNSKAINFYKKMGFIETGKKFFDERFIDLEITEMKLVLK